MTYTTKEIIKNFELFRNLTDEHIDEFTPIATDQKDTSPRKFPIIILSAVRDDSSRRCFKLEPESDLAIDNYVNKPIFLPVLLQRVEKALLERMSTGATSLTITRGGK